MSPLQQSGFLREVIWEEDGEMIDLGSRPSLWSPPEPDSPNHRCASQTCHVHLSHKDSSFAVETLLGYERC